MVGTLKNPGAAAWQEVQIDWGDGLPPSFATLYPLGGNATSPSYSTALGFTATHTYANNLPWDGTGQQPGYPVKATVLAANSTAPPLAVAATAVVNNVAPSELKIQLVDVPRDVPTTAAPQWFTLSGSFVDPGDDDSHTVTVDWGDNSTSTFTLVPGTRALDPNDDQTLLRHEYTSLPTTAIKVTVTDDGPGPNNFVLRTIAFRVLQEGHVLSTYNAEVQKVIGGSVVDEILVFADHLYNVVADKANAFATAVGDFASQLQDLEKTLRQLFTDSAPALLDGLLSDPARFGTNLMKAVGDGFKLYFDDFGENLKDSLFEWIKTKIPADLPITVADLPSNLTDFKQVAGFALKVMGLTRDDFVARLAGALGADNAQLLVQAYDFVQNLLDSDDPTDFITKLEEVLRGALVTLQNNADPAALLSELTFEKLAGAALDAIKGEVLNVVGAAAAAKAAQVLNPLAGSFKVLFDAGRWLVNNVQSVKGMAEVFVTVAAQVDKIKAGETGDAANEVLKGLKKVGAIGLDLAASVAGVNDIPTRVFTAVGGLRTKIQTPIDRVLDSVVAATKTKLNKILGDVGVGKTTDYTGLIGNVITFKVGSETRRLWAVGSSGTGPSFKPARFILSSSPETVESLEDFVVRCKEQAKYDPSVQTLIDTVIKSIAAAKTQLVAVETATAKFKADQAVSGSQTAKQLAEQNAKLTADVKSIGEKGRIFTATEGPSNQTVGRPTGEPVRPVCDLMSGACFVAGTPLRTPSGWKSIEEFTVGDEVLSRSELSPYGPVEVKAVEEVFVRTGRVLNLHVSGQMIETTFEHPFFEQIRGWVPARDLQDGDKIATLSGEWVVIEKTFDTGRISTVYNLRVADHHTYFVGADTWGACVWAHNTYLDQAQRVQFSANNEIISVAITYRQDAEISDGRNVAVAKVEISKGKFEYWAAGSSETEIRRYSIVPGVGVVDLGKKQRIVLSAADRQSMTSMKGTNQPYANLHSEEVLLAGLNQQGNKTKSTLKVTDFYTEYAPCGELSGSHLCSTRLVEWSQCTPDKPWSKPKNVILTTNIVKYSQFYPDDSAGRATHRSYHRAIATAVKSSNVARIEILGATYFANAQIAAIPLISSLTNIANIGDGIHFPLP